MDWRGSAAYGTSDAVDWATGVIGVWAAAAIGVLLATRRGANPIGWILLVLALVIGHYGVTESYVSLSLSEGSSFPGERMVANWDRGSWSLAFAPIVAIVFLFPEGPPPIRRWRLAAWGAVLSFAAVIVSETLNGDPLKPPFGDIEPYAVLPVTVAETLQVVGLAGMVVAFALAAWSIRRRFRDAGAVTRAQLKWLVYASAIVPLAILTGVIELAYSSSGEPGGITLALLLTLLIVFPGAKRCTVQFELDDGLELEIADDGAGVAPDTGSGVGMQSMRERARELGGTLTIDGREGGGTRVLARLPVGAP